MQPIEIICFVVVPLMIPVIVLMPTLIERYKRKKLADNKLEIKESARDILMAYKHPLIASSLIDKKINECELKAYFIWLIQTGILSLGTDSKKLVICKDYKDKCDKDTVRFLNALYEHKNDSKVKKDITMQDIESIRIKDLYKIITDIKKDINTKCGYPNNKLIADRISWYVNEVVDECICEKDLKTLIECNITLEHLVVMSTRKEFKTKEVEKRAKPQNIIDLINYKICSKAKEE